MWLPYADEMHANREIYVHARNQNNNQPGVVCDDVHCSDFATGGVCAHARACRYAYASRYTCAHHGYACSTHARANHSCACATHARANCYAHTNTDTHVHTRANLHTGTAHTHARTNRYTHCTPVNRAMLQRHRCTEPSEQPRPCVRLRHAARRNRHARR